MTSQFDAALHPRNSDGSGQFTEKLAADPGTGVLDDALVEEVIRLTGARRDEAQQAIEETNSLAAAVRHACQAATVRMHCTAINDLGAKSDKIRQQLNDHAVQATVRRILMRWPDANHIEMMDEEGDGNFTFNVFVDGEDVGDMDEFGMTDELCDLSCNIDYHDPKMLSKWVIGNDDYTYLPVGLDIDKRTGSLDRAQFDLSLFRDGSQK